jgi:hypothetical protein
MQKLKWIFFIVLIYCINISAQSTCQGIIASLKGTGTLQKNGKETKITSGNYRKIKLTSGQTLKVTGENDEMKLHLDCIKEEVIVSFNKPYTMRGKPEKPTGHSLDDRIWKPGGGHRTNNGGFILFPTEFPIESEETINVVRPETVVLRWATSAPQKFTVSLVVNLIQEAQKEVIIWKESNIAGETGSYTDDELKGKLKDIREKQPAAKLKLILRTNLETNGTENSVVFRIFSSEEEESLKQDLDKSNRENEGAITRAKIYTRYNLFIEAAQECEEALKSSPENIVLLKITSIAEDRAGNFKRRNELDEKIKTLQERK